MKRSLGKNWSLLYTPAVLYLIVAIALANLFFLLYRGDVRHTMIFILVGIITSFFSKNMIVILTVAIAFTGIAKMVSLGVSSVEGMTDGEEDTEDTAAASSSEPDASSATEKRKKEDVTENMEGEENEDDDDAEQKESFAEFKKDGQELILVQNKIEAGFKELEPYMDKADRLLTRIEESMTVLEQMKKDGKIDNPASSKH